MRSSITPPDNCVILCNGDVFEIHNILLTQDSEVLIYGRILLPIRSLYPYPMDSKILGTVVKQWLRDFEYFPFHNLSNKAVKIPIPRKQIDFAIVPYLHTDYNIVSVSFYCYVFLNLVRSKLFPCCIGCRIEKNDS